MARVPAPVASARSTVTVRPAMTVGGAVPRSAPAAGRESRRGRPEVGAVAGLVRFQRDLARIVRVVIGDPGWHLPGAGRRSPSSSPARTDGKPP